MTPEQFCARYAVPRLGTQSEKWDGLPKHFGDANLLPLWVADMDFKAPEAICEALVKRAQHGVFGYTMLPQSYYQALDAWQRRRHNSRVQPEWVRFSTGVVTALYRIINAFTSPGDAVVVLTPVYGPFFSAVQDTGRQLIQSPLQNKNGEYTMNFEEIEQQLQKNSTKMLILCSPHNPVGRVWLPAELETLFSLCQKHNVLILADEIHQDLITGDKKHIPALSVAGGAHQNRLITVTSASKTFNLAGLIHSHILLADEALRTRYDAYVRTVDHTPANLMAALAFEAGYTQGDEWLDALLATVRQNFKVLQKAFQQALPKAVISPLEGTYLMWVNLRAYFGEDEESLRSFVQNNCRLAVNYGGWFGGARGFIRLNLATTTQNIHKAAQSILQAGPPL